MRRLILPVMLIVVAACQEPGVAPLTDEDIAALGALRAAYVQGALSGDADAQAAQFAEDAIYYPPDTPALQGRAAIRAAAAAEAPGMTVQDFTITSLEVDGYGDLAFDRGTWTDTIVIEGMAEAITMTGSYIAIARKQADGSWLWTSCIAGTDAPMPQFEEPPE